MGIRDSGNRSAEVRGGMKPQLTKEIGLCGAAVLRGQIGSQAGDFSAPLKSCRVAAY
jgi:hypothetical protein